MLESDTLLARDATEEMPAGNYLEVLHNAMLTRPALLLQMIGAAPAVEGEHFLGYRVMKPEEPALLEYLGLVAGDILTAVNGVPFNTPNDAVQLLNAMSDADKLAFTVRRGDDVVVLY